MMPLHDGDCVPAGGWFALLVDATVVAWCRAKMSRSLLDDGFGGYYSKATMPFMFSNQCETVLDRLREAHSKVVDRQVFDLATGGAYDPKYPFRLEELNGLHSHFFSRYADSHSHLQPELADCYVPASKLCPGDCSFCSDAFADSYFDWRGQTAVTIRNMGKTSSHLGSQRIAKAYDGKWLMRTLSRHCAGFLSSKAAGNTPILYGISEQSELDDFPHHVYGITVGLKTGRLMGFFSWYRTGCGP
ncbi:hypothetical protein DFJ73DRAFT_862804 [Zopfochytrium polystomum]|nr:hypothetical protein DFJ73DRAFT_862804 [Zopfochytrium polystomum]